MAEPPETTGTESLLPPDADMSAPPSNLDSRTFETQCTEDAQLKDSDNRFSLRVKPEYVLADRDASLPVLVGPADSRETGGGGRKKKRMRKIEDCHSGPKLCQSVIRGGGDSSACPYKDKCKFSHDLAEYVKIRPPDLPNLTCPNYQLYGHCPYGVACRLGSQHTTKEGVNVTKDDRKEPTPTLNHLPREVQEQLRRNKYPFVCRRHRDTKKDSAAVAGTGTEDAPTPSFDPLPTKEVKLIDFSNKVRWAGLRRCVASCRVQVSDQRFDPRCTWLR